MRSGNAQVWFEKAVAALELANTADSSSERRDDLSNAIDALRETTLRAPDDVPAWLLMGVVLRDLGQESEAVEALDAVTCRDPDHVEAWFQKAGALQSLGRDHEALAACDEVLSRAPGRMDALDIKSIALGQLGRHHEALAACDTILQTDGGPSPQARFPVGLRKGAALAALGRGGEARSAFAAALAAGGPWASSSVALQEMLVRFEEARVAYLEGRQDQVAAWTLIGWAFVRADRAEDALVAFETAIGLGPGNPDSWWGKANALLACGRRQEAIPAYRESLRLRPGWAPVQQRLEALLIDLGEGREEPEPSPMVEPAGSEAPRRGGKGRRKADVANFRCATCNLFATMAALGSSPRTVLVRMHLDPGGAGAESSNVSVPAGLDRTAVHAIRGSDAQALYAIDPSIVPLYCPRCGKTYCLDHWTSAPAVSTHVRSCPEGHPRRMDERLA